MSRPDLVSMLLDVSIDPCDGSVHPSLQYVLIRGFSAMGWEQPKAASEDMAMEILKMIRPSSSNLASGGKVASREYPALGDRVATLLEDARCPKVTPAMEEAGRECARSNDPSTFADIFEAMWKARPTARPDTTEARLREALVDLHEAILTLSKFGKNNVTLFEDSPLENQECLDAWLRLNTAQTKAAEVLGPPFKLRFSSGWLASKIKSDPDIETDIGKALSPPADRREIVARIIDPTIVRDIEGVIWSRFEISRKDDAFRKADAILAALDGGR